MLPGPYDGPAVAVVEPDERRRTAGGPPCPERRAGPPASRTSPTRPRSSRRSCRARRRSSAASAGRARPRAGTPTQKMIRSELVSQRPGCSSISDTIRVQHHGNDDQRRGSLALDRVEHPLGVEPPLDDRRAPERHRQRHLREPEAVEHRRGDIARLPLAVRHLRQAAPRAGAASGPPGAARPSACRWCRWSAAPAGRARRAAAASGRRIRAISASSVVLLARLLGPRVQRGRAPDRSAPSARRTPRRARAASRPRARTRRAAAGAAKSVFRYSSLAPTFGRRT